MGQLARLFAGRELATVPSVTVETRSSFAESTLVDPAKWLVDLIRGALKEDTYAGETVTPDTAKTVPAILQAIRVRACTRSIVPLKMYRQRSNGTKEEIKDDPRAEICGEQWNEMTDACLGSRCQSISEDDYGNSYVFLDWAEAGILKGKYFLDPKRVELIFDPQGVLQYKYNSANGKSMIIPHAHMLHVPNTLSSNGLWGVPPLYWGADAVSVMIAGEKQKGRYFRNNAKFSGVLTHPKTLSQDAIDRLVKDFEEKHTGAANAYRPVFLEEGMKYEKTQMDATEIELVEAQKLAVTDASRIYNVPPIFLFDYGRATWGNSEEMFRQFVMISLLPEFISTEKRYNQRLLTPQERKKGYYFKHNVDAILRGDSKTRTDNYEKLVNLGAMNLDEVRELEERNPLPDGLGKIFRMPLNMAPIDQVPKQQDEKNKAAEKPPSKVEPDQAPDVKKKKEKRAIDIEAGIAIMLDDKLNLIQKKEINFRSKLHAKPENFDRDAAIGNFYDNHAPNMVAYLQPVVAAWCRSIGIDPVEERSINSQISLWVDKYCDTRGEHSVKELQQLFKDGDDDE